jgi:hypothetical protein
MTDVPVQLTQPASNAATEATIGQVNPTNAVEQLGAIDQQAAIASALEIVTTILTDVCKQETHWRLGKKNLADVLDALAAIKEANATHLPAPVPAPTSAGELPSSPPPPFKDEFQALDQKFDRLHNYVMSCFKGITQGITKMDFAMAAKRGAQAPPAPLPGLNRVGRHPSSPQPAPAPLPAPPHRIFSRATGRVILSARGLPADHPLLVNSNVALHSAFHLKLNEIGFTAERTTRLASKDVAVYLDSEESATKLLLHSQDWLEQMFSPAPRLNRPKALTERSIVVHGLPCGSDDPPLDDTVAYLSAQNNISVNACCWLVAPHHRAKKMHSSAILELSSDEQRRLLVGEGRLLLDHRTHAVEPCRQQVRLKHCGNCQRFRHVARSCRARHPVCRLCAQNHCTADHPTCTSCPGNSQAGCIHDARTCANCGGPHPAGEETCPHLINEMITIDEANRSI